MADTFLYFAYGSNMLSRRLKARNRTPSARFIGTGFVEGHRLTFDKVSKDRAGNRSGKCNIEATTNPADRVYGVLFNIPTAEETALDDAEGLGRGYRKDKVRVLVPDGACAAVAYIADNTDPLLLPYDWYKAFVIAGAVEHALPEAYVQRLQAVVSQPDPDPVRRAKNEAVLSES